MAKKDATAVVKKDDALPAYLQDKSYVSEDDGFGKDDFVIPQIKLLQATSGEITDHEEARAGCFWHTGLDVNLGTEIAFVIAARRKKYLLSAPMDDGQGIFARADDAKTWDRLGEWTVKVDKKTSVTWTIAHLDVAQSGLASWGSFDPSDENSPPAATLFYDYLVILPDHLDLGPAVMSVARSGIRKAKKGLNDKIALHQSKGRPIQSLIFRDRVTPEKNDAGQDYFNHLFLGGGFASEELFNAAREYENLLKTARIQDEMGAADDVKPRDIDEDDAPF